MNKPILFIGSNGQLARAFKELTPDAVFLDRSQADLAYPQKLTPVLEQYDPLAVINAAAYTQVDNAESEKALVSAINAQSPAAMAIYCAEKRIPFIHFSSDYVFDGSGDRPWREDDAPAPINAYGRSKLAGEDAITHVGGRYLIIRTSWVYDATGKNFLNTILRLAADREELKIIGDQYGAPTYAPHLAEATLAIVERAISRSSFPSGIYHLCGNGVTTWYDFALAIIEKAKRRRIPLKVGEVKAIAATEYPLPAPRPYNSRLDCAKALSMFGVGLAPWEQGLAECMELKK